MRVSKFIDNRGTYKIAESVCVEMRNAVTEMARGRVIKRQ